MLPLITQQVHAVVSHFLWPLWPRNSKCILTCNLMHRWFVKQNHLWGKKRTNNGRWLVKPSVYHHLSQVKFTFGCKRTTYWLSDLKTHVAASSSSKDAHRSEHLRFRHENTTWGMSRWIFEIMWSPDLPKPNVLQGNSHRKLTSSPMLPEPRSALSVSLWIHICSDNKDQVSITSAAITDWILLIQQVSISDMPVSFHALPLAEECKNKSYKPPRHLV